MDSQELEGRLRHVERRLRLVFITWGVSLIGIVLVGVLVGHAASQSQVLQADRVRAHVLEIDDATGKPRIILSVESGEFPGPHVRLGTSAFGTTIDPTKANVDLAANPSGASISVSSQSTASGANSHSALVAVSPGARSAVPTPFARLVVSGPFNGSNTASADLIADPQHVSLFLNDARGFGATLGNERLTTPSTGAAELRSAAALTLTDPQGKVLWSAP